jgi:hypothetical protein
MAVKKNNSTDKMPVRRMPEGFSFTKKKAASNKPVLKSTTAPAKATEKTAVTIKNQPVRKTGKIKITAGSASTKGAASPKAVVSGKATIGSSSMKVTQPKATKKPMTASEKAFIKNQKEKAKATKRTGVYPNTAN